MVYVESAHVTKGSAMMVELFYGEDKSDNEWGASFQEVKNKSDFDNIFVCYTTINDLSKIAKELSKVVMDKSWVMDIDPGARRAYEKTVAETAESLIGIFENKLLVKSKVSEDFGEIMVSMGSARALEVIFGHVAVPLAELWKPQLKGNEGFDFHTICSDQLLNFGEAKFSSSKNPYGGKSGNHDGAGGQADGFIEQDKHFRDRPHLVNLVDKQVIDNLDMEVFGVVLAFSMNAKNVLDVLGNAVEKALSYIHLKKAQNIYIVGVSYVSS